MFSRMRPGGAPCPLVAKVAAGGLALAAGLTACGGSSGGEGGQGGSGAAQAVRAAYEKTTSADTVTVALQGKQQPAKKSGKQQGQQGQQQGQQGKQASLSGEAVLNFADNASATTVNAPGQGGDSETRKIDNVVYQKVSKQQRAQVPGKKPWVKYDLQKINTSLYGDRAKAMLDNPPTDPGGMLTYLRGVTTAQESGNAEIRGAKTTHYKAKVDLKKAGKGQGPQVQQSLQQLGQQLGKRPLSLQVWLDEQDRVRRLKATLPASQPGAGGLVLTEEFYDYGQSVEVEAPSESKTASMTDKIIQQQKMRQQMQKQQQQQQQQQGQTPAPNQS